MIVPGQGLIVPELRLSKIVLQEARGASVTPPHHSRCGSTTWMQSTLVRAYHVPLQASQNDVNKRTLIRS